MRRYCKAAGALLLKRWQSMRSPRAQSAGAATTPARLQTLILLTGFPAESRSTTLGGALLQQYFGQMLQQIQHGHGNGQLLFHGRRARIGQSQAGGNVVFTQVCV